MRILTCLGCGNYSLKVISPMSPSTNVFLPSNWLCNFAPRYTASTYSQGRPRKTTTSYNICVCSLVWHWNACTGVHLQATIGQRKATAATTSLNCWTHIGHSFEGLPGRYWKVSHAVDSVLKLPW